MGMQAEQHTCSIKANWDADCRDASHVDTDGEAHEIACHFQIGLPILQGVLPVNTTIIVLESCWLLSTTQNTQTPLRTSLKNEAVLQALHRISSEWLAHPCLLQVRPKQ